MVPSRGVKLRFSTAALLALASCEGSRSAEQVGEESPWEQSIRAVCCDEHATPEDNIQELSWKRRHGSSSAEVSVGYFGSFRERAPRHGAGVEA